MKSRLLHAREILEAPEKETLETNRFVSDVITR